MNFDTQFPALEHCTYLNTAGSGILSRSVQQWRQLHDEDFIQRGSKFRLQQEDFLQDVRQHIARFFHSKTENTFLVPNFSFGFNTFLDALSPDHKFLMVSDDYPSLTYPVQSRGFRCAYVRPDEHLEENILEQIKVFKPTVLALSVIQYTTGIKIDLAFIKRLKSEYPDLLIVGDGTQFCGTENFNFEASGFDVLMASGYKWMLGGYGNGFVLLKTGAYRYLYPERTSSALPKEPFLKNKNQWNLCFEPGHLDTLNFGTLKQSLLFLEELGWDFIEKRLNSISAIAQKAFADRGLLSPAVAQRMAHSTIFNIQVATEMASRIQDADIVLAPRGAGMRASFHFYSSEQDLERLLGCYR